MCRTRELLILCALIAVASALLWPRSDDEAGGPATEREEADHRPGKGPGLAAKGVDPSKRKAPAGSPTAKAVAAYELDEAEWMVGCRVLAADGTLAEGAALEIRTETEHLAEEWPDDDDLILAGAVTAEVTSRALIIITAFDHVPHVLPWRVYKPGTRLDLGDIRLKKGGTIAGRVTRAGKPEGAVAIHLAPEAAPPPFWWRYLDTGADAVGTGRSGASGQFEVTGLPEGSYRVRVSWHEWDEVVLEGVATGTSDIHVDLEPYEEEEPVVPLDRVPFTFRVVTEDGGKVPTCGFYLHYFEAGGASALDYEIDRKVSFNVSGKAPFFLDVQPVEGPYAPMVVEGIQPSSDVQTITLRRGRVLEARLTGVDVPRKWRLLAKGARKRDDSVVAVRDPNESYISSESWRGKHLGDGVFRFEGLPERGDLLLTYTSHKHELPPDKVVVPVHAGRVTLHARVKPHIDLQIEGTPGRAVGSVYVHVEVDREGGWTELDHEYDEGESSTHAMRMYVDDASARHRVSVTTDDAGPIVVIVPPRPEAPVRVRLGDLVRVEGRVTKADGTPLVDAGVELVRAPENAAAMHTPSPWGTPVREDPDDPPTARTDVQGRYRLGGLPPGRWRIAVSAAGWVQRDPAPVLRRGRKEVDIIMVPAAMITGRILPGDDESMLGDDGVRVEAWPLAGDRLVHLATPAPSGFFKVPVGPDARYAIVIRPVQPEHDDYYNWYALAEAVAAGTRGAKIQLRRGRIASLDLVTSKGKPLVNADVRIRGRFVDEKVWPDDDGRFRMIGLPPGSYRFDVTLSSGARVSLPVTAGKTVKHVVR